MAFRFSRSGILVCISLVIFLAILLLNPFYLDFNANKVIAVAVLMILLWVTEAIPMAVVALLPLVVFPLLQISTLEATATAYSNPVIFLFMGGFLIGLAIEKWKLHKRIALNIVRLTGTSGDRVVLGFIIASGLISMWLSNTATTMMMFPIALSVIQVMKENHPNQHKIANFSLALMLSIAFASNFGGIATLIGTPPNVAYAAYIQKKYGVAIDFFKWMLVCMPISILLLVSLYIVMVKWLYPNNMKADASTKTMIGREVASLGVMSPAEKRVLVIFAFTAFLWITKDLLNKVSPARLDDTIIALIGAIMLFVCPSGDDKNMPLLQWQDTKNMAWGILLLFGGGIALATALEKAGLIEQLGLWLASFSNQGFMLILVITILSIFISEVMSNVAQVIVFAPVVSSLADALQMNPLLLGIPMTLAASCASMLPMGTPPNAIVFASGHIRLNQMTRTGFVMNVIAVLLISIFSWFVLPLVL
ncbi:MAG TPA: DASS family sodium-coupled anion symporter [Chitinophagaceae bacterium]|nr:DASS family sodium-coupled anion symporter [Chitinophagaceae bacterium]